jgi:toxin-antitoxin system PIN domain toxin
MGGVVDTNILLYAANSSASEHEAAHRFIDATRKTLEHWYLTEGILYEFLRVCTHPRVFPSPLDAKQALSFLQPLVLSESYAILTIGDGHWDALTATVQSTRHVAGNLFFDVRTVALMREHGIRRIYTADDDFARFTGIEPVNPLRAA